MKSFQFSGAANSYLQNKINKSIIFNYLRLNGPCFRARISKKLNISAPAVSRAIESLLYDGYVIETEKIKAANGKWTAQYKINPKKGYVIGIDLGKENLQIAITDFNGEIIVRHQGFKISDSEKITENIINEIEQLLIRYSRQNHLELRLLDLKAISVAIPASIDSDTGEILSAPTSTRWKNLNLKSFLTKNFDVPVYIENDVNLSALGEKHYGEGKKYSDVVFIEISYGIGAGIITDNHLLRGSFGYAGEIGCAILDIKNLQFRVKDRGFLESYASFHSIEKMARDEIMKGKDTIILNLVENDIANINPYVVCEAALKGDELAMNILNDVVKLLSLLMINLILIVSPQIVLIGGDICHLPDVNNLFIDQIIKYVKSIIPFKIPKIKLASLGEDAGIIGASFFAIESLLVGEFPYTMDYGMFG
jgi:predicted NBD/HSP70 family sugar kinase